LPLQEKTISGAGLLDSEQAHIAEAALQGFARTAAALFAVGTWRHGLAAALKLMSVAVNIIHTYTEEGKVNCDIQALATSVQFELISKWLSVQSASNPGSAKDACEVATVLLGLLRQSGVHWRAKVCVLATVGPALRILHLTEGGSDLDMGTTQIWLSALIACLDSRHQPQQASIALADLCAALRSAMKRPGLAVDLVLQEILPKTSDFLHQAAKTMSGLHQGHMSTEGGAAAQSDSVQCVVQAATGRHGVPQLNWIPCPSAFAWASHTMFFQSYATFRFSRGDASLVDDFRVALAQLQSQPKSEREDHVTFIEMLAGLLRASRRWPLDKLQSLWAAIGPIAAEELRTVEEESVRNWQFLVYYVVCGVSRRLRLKPDKPSEDPAIRILASFLCGVRDVNGPPHLVMAESGDGESSSHLHSTRLRLLQVLLVSLQRKTGQISDSLRQIVLSGLVPTAQRGIAHPYKQVRDESSKALVLSFALSVESEVIRNALTWLKTRASELSIAMRDAPRDSEECTACGGLVYVFLHALLARRLRSMSFDCSELLLAAVSGNDPELRAIANVTLVCLGRSHQRRLEPLALAQRVVDLSRPMEGDDANPAQRSRRLESVIRLISTTALRQDFAFRLSGDEPGLTCRRKLIEFLGDRRLEVRVASQTALAPLLSLDCVEACKRQVKTFATMATNGYVDQAVHGLSAMLNASACLGVPVWLGSVIEALSKVGKHPEAKREVQKTVQAFMKQQQQSRDLWKRCQARLSETQMELLKVGQGNMSYYS